MKDNNVECLFGALFFNNGIIITFIIKINLTNVIIFPSESMKRACSNNKSKFKQRNVSAESKQPFVFYTMVKILMIVTILLLSMQQNCIVLYCIMRPFTDGPIGPLSYRLSSRVVRNPHSTLAE